jgi:hypothetical protein
MGLYGLYTGHMGHSHIYTPTVTSKKYLICLIFYSLKILQLQPKSLDLLSLILVKFLYNFQSFGIAVLELGNSGIHVVVMKMTSTHGP